MVGFSTGEGTGHFTINNPVPGIPNNQATDNYAVQGTGSLYIPVSGQYTFGLNTDDGARLRIDGTNIIVDDGPHSPHDSTFATIPLATGWHSAEWTWFNIAGGANGGGAEAELFAAVGRHTGFDSSFQLVGNTPGLCVGLNYSIPIIVLQTNRTPTKAEASGPVLIPQPTPSQLKAFVGGSFTDSLSALDTNHMTVVMTHGWNSDPNGWATNMAVLMIANLGAALPNIVAWDWRDAARSSTDQPGTPAKWTPDQGFDLGQALANALGPNYSKPIHFIGHSLGTLVNAYAADYLHGNGFAWTNTHITLFDEAEAATDMTWFGSDIDTLIGMNGNPLSPKPYYYYPLPKQFLWADNYVSAFGLLHTNAVNVILTNNYPANAPTVSGWFDALTTFHGYPIPWYNETIQTNISALGFLWSFERGGLFSQAPKIGTAYLQAGSEWHLSVTNWDYGTNLLNARFQAYRNSLAYAITGKTPGSVAVNGHGFAEYYTTGLVGPVDRVFDNLVLWLMTTPANISQQIQAHMLSLGPNAATSITNVPAYAWIPLAVPTNAISISFDYKIQGDWKSDSLAAAFNGTNVLSLPGSQIGTNVLFNSGPIVVSAFAGQTNELFIGIVGGTSTNAQLTVQSLAFSISSPPLLQAQMSGSNHVLTWPLSAAEYILQKSSKLSDTNSWSFVTNVPAIVNLQNVITNPAADGAGFFRLKK